MRAVLLACLLLLVVPASGSAASPWPYRTLQLGLEDVERGAADLRAKAPMGLRYHYLAGGVNTGGGWQTWGNGNGSFVRDFIEDSAAHGFTPAFSLYELRQSLPGARTSDEESAVVQNLQDADTMRAYFADLEAFFRVAGATRRTTVLHVEPDPWGYVQRRSGGDARLLRAEVPDPSVADTAAGFAQAIVRLRDRLAPNVLLGYHVSIWGTNKDIAVTNEPDAVVDDLAAQAARFRETLGARFDLTFFETTDRDAGFAQNRDGVPAATAWWDDADFLRLARFIARFRERVPAPVVLWQTPLGNQRMRAMDNTAHHFQDNKVEKLLDDPDRRLLRTFNRAGVVAVLFGAGQAEGTCACDAAGDGVTNPAPITGNTRLSLSADDDGGLFKELAARYARRGALPLAVRVRAPSAGRRQSAASSGQRARRSSFTSRVKVTRVGSRRFRLVVSARTRTAATALLSVEITRDGRKVFQRWRDRLRFRAGRVRSFSVDWPVPRGGEGRTFVVKVGVFGPGWKPLLRYDDRAATIRP